MPFSENFDVDEGDFTLYGGTTYQAGLGYPASGCVKVIIQPSDGLDNSIISYMVQTGDVLEFYYRIIDCTTADGNFQAYLETVEVTVDADQIAFDNQDDTGWLLHQMDLSAIVGETINYLSFTSQTGDTTSGYVLLDSISIGGVSFGFTHSGGGIPGAIT